MKQKKKMTSTGFLLLITIVLFFVMYAAGMVIFADKGFAKPQMFLNLFVSNAGLLVISCGLTIVMITGGIDISVGSVTALVCMVMADLMENKGVSAYVAVLAALLIGLAFGIVPVSYTHLVQQDFPRHMDLHFPGTSGIIPDGHAKKICRTVSFQFCCWICIQRNARCT